MKFDDLFHNINVPILVYEDSALPLVVYENFSAVSLLKSTNTSEDCQCIPLKRLLKIPQSDYTLLFDLLNQNHEVSEMHTTIRLSSGERIPVILSANRLQITGVSYVKLCIYPQTESQSSHTQILLAVIRIAYEAETTERAIQTILSQLGEYMHVSRISIFEAISDSSMSNTYEWCLSDVEARIASFQNIPKQQLYNLIMNDELVTDDDSRIFFAGDEIVIGASESQSVLSVPILSRDGPLGYMVLEDCTRRYQWSWEDVQLLYDFSTILAFFIVQREEQGLHCNWSILNTVTDHLDDMMYVNDMNTKEILFANRALADAVSIPLQELEGRSSSQVMQKLGRAWIEGYPMQCMVAGDQIIKRNHTWEFFHESTGKWYLVRSAIIKWIDDRDVYFETLTDITEQKKHVAKLEHIACTDRMTGVYNREWGYRLIEHLLEHKESGQTSCLVFIDLDHLKRVNDCFGHTIGDQMIIKAVSIIQTCIRKSDTLCRWGGDEFLIIVRAKEEDTCYIIQKIKDHMDAYNASGLSLFELKFSYGIVEINAQTRHTIESLITEADQRMYQNKMKRFQSQ